MMKILKKSKLLQYTLAFLVLLSLLFVITLPKLTVYWLGEELQIEMTTPTPNATDRGYLFVEYDIEFIPYSIMDIELLEIATSLMLEYWDKYDEIANKNIYITIEQQDNQIILLSASFEKPVDSLYLIGSFKRIWGTEGIQVSYGLEDSIYTSKLTQTQKDTLRNAEPLLVDVRVYRGKIIFVRIASEG
ncbi:hypothetical protein [Liberiplasma polymorphum]|uniref:hypothetical protein n=1 Tax=Liberiplasma polymorphum TaxID=3374570 RepID=UPI003773A4CA